MTMLAACGGGGSSNNGSGTNTPQPTAAQRLAADVTFGNQGNIALPFGTADGRIIGASLQSDGKLLIAGWRQTGLAPDGGSSGGPPREIVVWRLTPNGVLDSSFGAGGLAALSFEGSDRLSDVALQSDGRIILASASTVPCSNTGFGRPSQWICVNANGGFTTPKTVLARLTGTGLLDPSFGERGRVDLAVGSTWNWSPQIALQDDQKVLVLHQEESPVARILNWRLQRLTSGGTTDPTFNQGADVVSRCGVSGNALAVAPGGRILVAGSDTASYVDPTANPGACIEAFLSNGQADASFNAGQPLRLLVQNNVQVNALRVLDDGHTVLAGTGKDPMGYFFYVQRFTASGSADTSFGVAGLIRSAVANDLYSKVTSTLATADGSVVVSGYAYNNSLNPAVTQPTWLRWTSFGQPDQAFGPGGVYLPGGADAPVALLRDVSGRWLSVSLTKGTDGQFSVVVSRLQGDTAMP